MIDFLITHNRFYDIIIQERIRDIEKYKLVISQNRYQLIEFVTSVIFTS